jgi:outer membrane receptor for ferrienterochelin and colicins
VETNAPSLDRLADLSLEALSQIPIATVTGASRYEQKETQAPATVYVVTGDEVKKQGYRTLAEMLESVTGFYVSDDRNYSYLGVRGFGRPGDYNDRVLLLVDGHRVNDNIYGQALLGTEGILDVDLIDHVEAIVGPASSLYGDNAFLGVISVTTKRGGDIHGAQASVEAGGYDTFKGRFTCGQKFTNDVELLISGTVYYSGGQNDLYFPEFDNAADNHGVVPDADRDRAQSVFASLAWKDFTLTSAFSNREKQIPTASFGTVFDSGGEQTTDLRTYVDLKFEHEFETETRLAARLYYDLYSYKGDYPYYATDFGTAFNPAEIFVNHDSAQGQWMGTDWQVTQKVLDRHTLLAGVEYREDLQQQQHSYYDESGLPDVLINRTGRNVGVFGQAEISLLTNLTFFGGVRYDYYTTFGDTVNPRLCLIYGPWERTVLKFLYGQAFRAPNDYELYYEDPGSNKANPDLSPETISSYDLVVEEYLPANLRFSASGYFYEIDNLISQQVDSLGQTYFDNVDQAQSKGVELQLERRSPSGVVGRIGYTYQRTENTSTGEELSNSPKNLAKLGLTVPLYPDRVFSGLEVLYTGSVRTPSGGRSDGFTVVNFTLFSQKLVRGLEASVTLYNLFDSNYGYAAGEEFRQNTIPAQGRSFRVKLTYSF